MPRDQVGVRGAGQGEVEQDQLAALAAQRAQRQVVGLDVAVPDTSLVEEGDGLEQVLAEPLELVMVSGPCWRSSSARVWPPMYSTPMMVRRLSGGPASKGGSSRRATCESLSWPSCSASRSRRRAAASFRRDLEDALGFAAVLDARSALEVEPLPSDALHRPAVISSPRPAVSGSCPARPPER